MKEVPLAEPARNAAEALTEDLDRGPHAAERVREAEAILIYRLVDDRDALGLGQCDDERLLPVGHEAWVHVRLDDERRELAARVVEANAVITNVEPAPELPERVEERHHVPLESTLDEDVTLRHES